jgi:hypothetical protein
MFTSSAEVFRRRQVVSDLISVVRAHSAALDRLGSTPAECDAIAGIVAKGCVLSSPAQDRLASHLLLAAALPDDDFPGFICATSILVVNRLSYGRGQDDLYWNWDVFRLHYRLADPPVRAALMNGFRAMDIAGLVTLDGGPSAHECLSVQRAEVLTALAPMDPLGLGAAIRKKVTVTEAGRLWRRAVKQPLDHSTRAGFRYLYERPMSMEPQSPEAVQLIPWA